MNYDMIRKLIRGMVVPMPLMFKKDLNIDYKGIEDYTRWLVEKGIKTFCTTFVYSVLDSITTKENLEITKTIASVVKGNGIFIACTAGGPLRDVVDIVKDMEKAGADAVFVHPPLFVVQGAGGDFYFNYLKDVLTATNTPVFSVALPDPWKSLNTPMLNIKQYEALLEHENYMGFKDDIYQIPLRQAIAERFGDRICVIGGGDFKKYVVNCHLPGQSEFAGFYNPVKQKKIFDMLEQNNYLEAISAAEQDAEAKGYNMLEGMHWIVCECVLFWAMGFSESYLVRPPLKSATPEQAKQILKNLQEKREFFERDIRD